jgi:hypothetical protein
VRLCACGCGEEFKPRRKNHRYMDGHPRSRKTVAIRVPTEQAPQIRARICHQNGHKPAVQRIVATDEVAKVKLLGFVKRQASWLKERLGE